MKRFVVFLSAMFLAVVGYAQPKYFRVMWNEDPSTSLVVGWSQSLLGFSNGSNFKLYYSETDHGTDTALYALDNAPIAPQREVMAFKSLNHYFVRLNQLKPKTAYYFVIAYTTLTQQPAVTQRYWTKTSSDSPNDRISILAGGDSRLNVDGGPIALLESITIRKETNKVIPKLLPDLVAFGGDYTFANTEQEWDAWLADWELTYTEDNKITPLVAAIGNHEHSPWGCPDCGNHVVYNLFDTPAEDAYYAQSFGGNLLRLYTLNTEMAITGDQTDWLVDDLESHDLNTYWKMAQYHKPMRPHEAGKSDMNEAFDNWAEPFYNYQVRLAIECDAHVVKATWPLIPSRLSDGETECGKSVDQNFFKAENGRGTTFVGEGTWAAIRTANDAKSWTRDMGTLNQLKWIWVDKNEMQVRTVKTYDADNATLVDNMQSLTEENRFTVPEGIELWEPENGSVIFIKNNGLTPVPEKCAVTTSVEDKSMAEGLQILPNPTRDKTFTIRFQGSNALVGFEIYGSDAKTVWKQPSRSKEVLVRLADVPKGVYFVKAIFESGQPVVKRFILD